MKPVDYRNETFAGIKGRLFGQRLAVYEAWKQFGPCTTAQLAERSGLSILTLRPRTTELFQLGLVICTGGHSEGIYRAASEFEARAAFDAAKRDACREQLQMRF